MKSYSQLFPDACYGPFTKRIGERGPQEQMHQRYEDLQKKNAKHSKSMRFVAEDVNEKAIKRYWLMTTKALQRILEINREDRRNNCFYEIMPSPECTYRHSCNACKLKLKQYGTRAYLDLEFPDPCDWESFETSDSNKAGLGEEIANAFGQYLEKTYDCKAEPRIMKSHRPGKYSWHVVFACTRNGNEIVFRNSLTLLTAIKGFFHKGLAKPYVYYSNEGDEEKNVIDESVYSTHKLYRTLHSQKYGRLTGSFVVEQGPDAFEEHLVLQPYMPTHSSSTWNRQIRRPKSTPNENGPAMQPAMRETSRNTSKQTTHRAPFKPARSTQQSTSFDPYRHGKTPLHSSNENFPVSKSTRYKSNRSPKSTYRSTKTTAAQ